MITNQRNFTRSFAQFRDAALAGQEVTIRDRAGHEFIFSARTSRPRTLAEAAAHLAGQAQTGVARKSLQGYGK